MKLKQLTHIQAEFNIYQQRKTFFTSNIRPGLLFLDVSQNVELPFEAPSLCDMHIESLDR